MWVILVQRYRVSWPLSYSDTSLQSGHSQIQLKVGIRRIIIFVWHWICVSLDHSEVGNLLQITIKNKQIKFEVGVRLLKYQWQWYSNRDTRNLDGQRGELLCDTCMYSIDIQISKKYWPLGDWQSGLHSGHSKIQMMVRIGLWSFSVCAGTWMWDMSWSLS